MSQSLNSAADVPSEQGDQSFADLNSMIKQGRSFSGYERNCCFLNTCGASELDSRFANISAASGLDYDDDGRAVALVDWDSDGDLDLWVANRNAPRLRLMRNDTPSLNRFLALRLVGDGDTTNRDAIGARVEVKLADPDAPPLIKTLRAGEGFIAQSTKWLHFGLGDSESIEKVIVRWPNNAGSGDNVQEFSSLNVDQHYRLLQGQREPVEVSVRQRQLALKPSEQKVPSRDDTARIRLVALLPFPKLRFSGRSGELPISIGGGKPVLLTLWASWCTPCQKELAEFTNRADEIRAAGIEVVALSVDKPADLDSAAAMLQKIRFPFYSTPCNQQFVRLLQWHHDTATRQEQQMPIPVSFLIDADGRLAAVYKGRLDIDDLIADVSHSAGTRTERWVRSALLPGRTIEHPNIEHIAELYDVTVYLRAASGLLKDGQVQGAMSYYREVLRLKADEATALNNLAWILSTDPHDKIRNGTEALQLARRLVNSDRELDANQLDTLAVALAEAGQFSEAAATARQAIARARSENLENLARTIEARLALYEREQPYHDRPR